MSATRSFRTWWDSSGLSQEQVAARLRISQGQVSKLLSGARQHPDAGLAAAIEKLTGGKVKASSWPRRIRRVPRGRRSAPVADAARDVHDHT